MYSCTSTKFGVQDGAALNGMGVQHLYNVWGWLASPWGWVGGGGALDQNKDIDIVPRPCPGS